MMFKWLGSRIFWGAVLILGGVMLLLQNLGNFEFGGLFWGALFLLGGIFFLSAYLNNHANWWAFIPGFPLLGIGVLILLDVLAPQLSNVIGGSIVLGAIGLAFLAVYLVDRRNWWAIIPAGVMLTLTLIVAFGEQLGGMAAPSILFMGMGLTFALVAVLPNNPAGQMRWAWIPAGILFVMGVAFSLAAGNLVGLIGPAAMILGGLYLLYVTVLRK
jgi:hypothetical protein